MAELLPSWMQENCYPAQYDRLMLGNVVATEGVADIAGGSLLVTTAGADLDVSVAQGGGWVEGDDDDRGMYSIYNDGPVTVSMDAADPTNPRIDQVIARVYDTTYGEGADEWVLEPLSGTATGGATLANLNGAAALPDNAIRLAYILVPATFTGPFVNATHILDARLPFQTADATEWHSVGAAGEPAFENSWVNDTASGWQVTQFRRVGDTVEVRGAVESGTATSTIFTLPVGFRPPDEVGHIQQSTATGAATTQVAPSGAVSVSGYIGAGSNSNVNLNFRFSVTT